MLLSRRTRLPFTFTAFGSYGWASATHHPGPIKGGQAYIRLFGFGLAYSDQGVHVLEEF